MQLAPRTPSELLRWMFLCIIVGISEELVFRGYLMRQFLSWSGGSKTAAVVLSAVCFGASHGYQGITGMVGITVLGVLYGIVALKRGNLRVCIFAHIMQDLMAGIALFLLYNLGR
jgi:membrane protease YdiL (CAAX protease family)